MSIPDRILEPLKTKTFPSAMFNDDKFFLLSSIPPKIEVISVLISQCDGNN
jgi:hypothetical protein